MDRLIDARSREERIRELIEVLDCDWARASFIVDLADGKTNGCFGGLSNDERHRLGLNRPLWEMEPNRLGERALKPDPEKRTDLS